MSEDGNSVHSLFDGAVSCTFPIRFEEYKIHEHPIQQEEYGDTEREELIMFSLIQLRHEVADLGAASWFFNWFASKNNAQEVVIEQCATLFEANMMPGVMASTCIGKMPLADQSLPVSEQERVPVKVYLANLRLRQVLADVLIIAYEPIINETASPAGDDIGVPNAAETGRIPMAQVFTLILDTFRVDDWSHFDM